MGMSIRWAFGRTTPLPLLQAGMVEYSQAVLKVFGSNFVKAEFEIREVPELLLVKRNMSMYSWLGASWGRLKPFRERDEAYEDEVKEALQVMGAFDNDDVYIGDYNYQVFRVEDLINFDYEQLAIRRDPEEHVIEGWTYLKHFGSSGDTLRACLRYAKESGWKYLILGFDV